MLMLCWSLVHFQFCACPRCTVSWFSYDRYIQHMCSVYLFWFFCHRVYWTMFSKILYSDLQVPGAYLLEIQIFCTCARSQGSSPCRWSVPAIDFCVCVRDRYFCVYVHRREKLPLWARNDVRILGLRRRGMQSRARDEAWSRRAFVWSSFIKV